MPATLPAPSPLTGDPFGLPGLVWRELALDLIPAEALSRGLIHDLPGGDRRVIAPPPELQRARRKRRREWLAGRLCALSATAALGQPSLLPAAEGPPRWPEGIFGSITHRGNRAIAVASRHLLLGVDCELHLDAETAEALSRTICRPAEIARRPPAIDVPLAVTLLFSAKEALFKALSGRVEAPGDWRAAEAVAWDGHILHLSCAGRIWSIHWQSGAKDVLTLLAEPARDLSGGAVLCFAATGRR